MIRDANDKPVAAHPYEFSKLCESTALTVAAHRAINRQAYIDRIAFRNAMRECGNIARWRNQDTQAADGQSRGSHL